MAPKWLYPPLDKTPHPERSLFRGFLSHGDLQVTRFVSMLTWPWMDALVVPPWLRKPTYPLLSLCDLYTIYILIFGCYSWILMALFGQMVHCHPSIDIHKAGGPAMKNVSFSDQLSAFSGSSSNLSSFSPGLSLSFVPNLGPLLRP